MKRKYYAESRSKSYERRKHRHSHSRSREKHKKSSHNNNITRQNSFRVANAKVESDIKNHFRLKLPNLSPKEQEDTIMMLKSKLNQHIGPVEHITRSKEMTTLNLGFKYDIDALSFLENGVLTVKTSSHKIHLQPIPTKAFQHIIRQHAEQMEERRRSNSRRKKSKSKSKSRSYSSSSSSRHKKKNYRSESKQKITYIKIQVYGLPTYMNEDKAVSLISQGPGGPYKILKPVWRKAPQSNCEYLEVRIDTQKADKLLDMFNKLQVEGRPVIGIQQTQRPTKQLINYQIQLQFPKPVHPGKVIKYLQYHGRVVQLVATQQIQQDGKSKGYIITLNDRSIISSLRKLGELSNGIRVTQPKHGHYVYRPIYPLPTRHQL